MSNMKLSVGRSVRFIKNFPTDLKGQQIFRITGIVSNPPPFPHYYTITNNRGSYWMVAEDSIIGVGAK